MQAIASTTAGSGMTLQEGLGLLVTQLKNQNPLSPTDNSQIVNQLATLDNSQQIRKMAQSVQGMLSILQVNEACAMIGRTADVRVAGSTAVVSGTVTSVTVQDGTPHVVVDGTEYTLDAVTRIH